MKKNKLTQRRIFFLAHEVEAVPDGYQKDRRKIATWAEFQEETCIPDDEIPSVHLPIVHVRSVVMVGTLAYDMLQDT